MSFYRFLFPFRCRNVIEIILFSSFDKRSFIFCCNAGTDEAAIIHVVATRCNAQRQQMKTMFKTMYGRVGVCLLLLADWSVLRSINDR